MRRLIAALPGPQPVRYALLVLVAILLLVVLFFVYDWIGTNLLDSGGTIG
jgi:hypothetical protein